MQKYKKYNVRISKEIRDIIHGYVMSDGYLSKTGNLQVDQGLDQEKFVRWLYEKLKPICTDTGPTKVKRTDKRTNCITYSMRFFTRNLLCGFTSMWYTIETLPNGEQIRRKKLPKSIACFFNPTFLTIWFAGDGTKQPDYRSAKFEVTAFTVEERLLLKELFESKFSIKVSINKAGISKTGTQQWTLQVPADEYDKFRNLITKMDLIPTIFPYKLHKKQS